MATICPSCLQSTTAENAAAPVSCPHCGQPFDGGESSRADESCNGNGSGILDVIVEEDARPAPAVQDHASAPQRARSDRTALGAGDSGMFGLNPLGLKDCPMCGLRVDRLSTVCPGCGEPFADTLHALLGGRLRYVTAGLWLRLLAFVIDAVCLAIPLLVIFSLSVLLPGVDRENLREFFAAHAPSLPAACLILYGAIWPYFSILECSAWQGTIGKRCVGIRVTDLSGRRPSFVQSTIRHFSKLVSLCCFGMGLFAAAFSDAGQAWHDVISNCVVIRDGSGR